MFLSLVSILKSRLLNVQQNRNIDITPFPRPRLLFNHVERTFMDTV
jgi:hypothetical protein